MCALRHAFDPRSSTVGRRQIWYTAVVRPMWPEGSVANSAGPSSRKSRSSMAGCTAGSTSLRIEPASGCVLVGEVKTELHDLGEIERTMGWYERLGLANVIGPGWRPRSVVGILFVLATRVLEDRIARIARRSSGSIRVRGSAMQDWLDRSPHPPLAGRGLALIDPRRRGRTWALASDHRRVPPAPSLPRLCDGGSNARSRTPHRSREHRGVSSRPLPSPSAALAAASTRRSHDDRARDDERHQRGPDGRRRPVRRRRGRPDVRRRQPGRRPGHRDARRWAAARTSTGPSRPRRRRSRTARAGRTGRPASAAGRLAKFAALIKEHTRGARPAREPQRRQADHRRPRRGHRGEPRVRLLRRRREQGLRPDDPGLEARASTSPCASRSASSG